MQRGGGRGEREGKGGRESRAGACSEGRGGRGEEREEGGKGEGRGGGVTTVLQRTAYATAQSQDCDNYAYLMLQPQDCLSYCCSHRSVTSINVFC